MKPVDLRAKSEDELNQLLVEKRKEQFNLRFQSASGQLSNNDQVRQVRKDIARIKTIVAERQREADPQVA